MELKDILLSEKHPTTGLEVVRQFIGIANADKENGVIQIAYYEFQKGLDGQPYEITRKKKVYVLNGTFFEKWYNYPVTSEMIGGKLGANLIEGNAELTLASLPIDCPDGYTIQED